MVNGTNNKIYNKAGFEVELKRNWIPYIWNYYLPTFGIIWIGSISFLIMPNMVPGRIALLLFMTLVLINFFNGLKVSNFVKFHKYFFIKFIPFKVFSALFTNF